MLATGLSLLVVAFVFGYAICQVAAVRRWRSLWRLAAAVPAVVVTFVSLKIVYEVGVDLDSHKLWPIEALLWSAAGLGYLSALYLVRGLFDLARAATGEHAHA